MHANTLTAISYLPPAATPTPARAAAAPKRMRHASAPTGLHPLHTSRVRSREVSVRPPREVAAMHDVIRPAVHHVARHIARVSPVQRAQPKRQLGADIKGTPSHLPPHRHPPRVACARWGRDTRGTSTGGRRRGLRRTSIPIITIITPPIRRAPTTATASVGSLTTDGTRVVLLHPLVDARLAKDVAAREGDRLSHNRCLSRACLRLPRLHPVL
mmetsp:Transcript_17794/g.31721  ORF Transcript_17794/g.31721 Transcript_17794/m.31721 type:complete len:214 (+) Transcript_17794:1-642(+)